MGGACCKAAVIELNPDGTPKEPQTAEQVKQDPKDLRKTAKDADWVQMRMLLRRMPQAQIQSMAKGDEYIEEEAGNTALHFSVTVNHMKGVRKLVRYGHKVFKCPNKSGDTPLHLALETGKLKATEFLMAPPKLWNDSEVQPAGLNETNKKGCSPFLNIVAAGRRKLVMWVLERYEDRIDYDIKDKQGNTVILYAAKYGWFDLMSQWVDKLKVPEKILNLQNKQGETVLGWVLKFAASGLLGRAPTLSLVTKLLELGALPNLVAFPERVPPINLAAAANHMDVYNLLISRGVDPVKGKDCLGRTALHYAAAKGAVEVAGDLLTKGLLPYVLDKQKNTPLHLASLRGQKEVVALLVDRADDPVKALLTANKAGLSSYHLALKGGNSENVQAAALDIMARLGEQFNAKVMGKKDSIVETPLLLAIGSHQEQVVKKLLEKGVDVNEGNVRGELPLARNLAAVTALTYDSDADIFDQIIRAGASMVGASDEKHPLLAVCRNGVSMFAKAAVGTLAAKEQEAGRALDWNKRDEKGYTPLMLASYHDNAWLVSHLIDVVKVDPNDAAQRTKPSPPEVIGTTGALCCKADIVVPGTVGGQTPLMCAAKGCSVGALKLLLNRGAKVDAQDESGRTALGHAMHMDRLETLACAALLLDSGAKAESCVDLIGESWAHRAVRYGVPDFLRLWAAHGGSLEALATTADDADDMPGAELKEEEKGDFIDMAPARVDNELEDEDEVLPDDGAGEDSEAEKDDGEGEGAGGAGAGNGTRAATAAKAKATGASGGADAAPKRRPSKDQAQAAAPAAAAAADATAAADEGRDDDIGADDGDDIVQLDAGAVAEGVEDGSSEMELARMIADGQVETHYRGPTPKMIRAWRRQGAAWWDGFWVDAESDLPPTDLEDEPGTEDKYTYNDAGEEFIDEEDVLDEIMDQRNRALKAAAPSGTGVRAARAAKRMASQGDQDEAPGTPTGGKAGLKLSLSQLANKILRRGADGRKLKSHSIDVDGTPFSGGSSLVTSAANTPRGGSRSPNSIFVPVPMAGPAGPVAEGVEAAVGSPRLLPAGPVAESLATDIAKGVSSGEGGGSLNTTVRTQGGKSFITIEQSAGDKALSLVAGTPGERLWINEPYYQPATRYKGRPKYMDEKHTPLGQLVDVKDEGTLRGLLDGDDVVPNFNANWNVQNRLAAVQAKKEKMLTGPALRERNIKWYHKSMSPEEFPLGLGKWKAFVKKGKKAAEAAKARRPRKPTEKPQVRAKTVWFGIPDLPSRPELNNTSPLVYAVRLGRAECVEALLELSTGVNIPDGFGNTPIGYAMFLLCKDRHHKSVQRIADLLLSRFPYVSHRYIAQQFMVPRVKQELAAMEADIAAKEAAKAAGTGKAPTRKEKKAVEEKAKELQRWKTFDPSEQPRLMDPIILAMLLGDTARLGWMVFKCAGNLNDAYVGMVDIPTYLQGMWEKMCGRCQSRVLPLHLAIMSKKYDNVRLLLDMGADPNAFGVKYTGNIEKDRKERTEMFQDKVNTALKWAAKAVKSNPYENMWHMPSFNIIKLLSGIKNFISGIEIPGITRPHPWVSPLHLAARFGQAQTCYLLVKRGAQVNGGGAAAYAKKTPLEEALTYARSNAQSYNILGSQVNYEDVCKRACIKESNPVALDHQKTKLADVKAKLMAKAEALATKRWEEAKAKAAKDNKPAPDKPSADALYLEMMLQSKFKPAELGDFSKVGLKGIKTPGMNLECLANAATEAASKLMDLFDPTKAAMFALAQAAKILVKIVINMIKRPICHWDPALFATHVLLYHRAPLHTDDRQTRILLHDMISNRTYAWLDLDGKIVADEVWKSTTVEKIRVLKTNWDFGYQTLDMTSEPKKYRKMKRQFEAQVDHVFYTTGVAAVLPAYYMPVLLDHIKAAGTGGDLRTGAYDLVKGYVTDAVDKHQDKLAKLEKLAEGAVKAARKLMLLAKKCPDLDDIMNFGMPDFDFSALLELDFSDISFELPDMPDIPGLPDLDMPDLNMPDLNMPDMPDMNMPDMPNMPKMPKVPGIKDDMRVPHPIPQVSAPSWYSQYDATLKKKADEVARGLLPAWYTQLNDVKDLPAYTIVELISNMFGGFKPGEQAPRLLDGTPQGKSYFDLMVDNGKEDSFAFKPPKFPRKVLEKKEKTRADIEMVDVVKAVHTSYIAVKVKDCKARMVQLLEEHKTRSGSFIANVRRMAQLAVNTKMELMQAKAAFLRDAAYQWDEQQVFKEQVEDVDFAIAAIKLGGAGPAIVEVLRSSGVKLKSALFLAAAKAVGAKGIEEVLGAGLRQKYIELAQEEVEAEVFEDVGLVVKDFIQSRETGGMGDAPAAGGSGMSFSATAPRSKSQAKLARNKQELIDTLGLGPEGGRWLGWLKRERLNGNLPSNNEDVMQFAAKVAAKVGASGDLDRFLEVVQDAVGKWATEEELEEWKDGITSLDVDEALALEDPWAAQAESTHGSAFKLPARAQPTSQGTIPAELYAIAVQQMKERGESIAKMAQPEELTKAQMTILLPGAGTDVQGSVEALARAMQGANDSFTEQLTEHGEAMLEELQAGFEVDMQVDLEGIMAALQEGREAFVSILELLDIDL